MKLNLKSQSHVLYWGNSEVTEEGYRRFYVSWEYDSKGIWRESASRELDCDGLLDREWLSLASIEEKMVEVEPGIYKPEFKRLETRQRDYEAEGAGY